MRKKKHKKKNTGCQRQCNNETLLYYLPALASERRTEKGFTLCESGQHRLTRVQRDNNEEFVLIARDRVLERQKQTLEQLLQQTSDATSSIIDGIVCSAKAQARKDEKTTRMDRRYVRNLHHAPIAVLQLR